MKENRSAPEPSPSTQIFRLTTWISDRTCGNQNPKQRTGQVSDYSRLLRTLDTIEAEGAY